MIKTPLSTVIGGAFWTPGATVINGAKISFEIVMKKLFANGEQGFWYDPNDMGMMFQDAAGTTPVTAAGQAVGLIRDKSGRNNHAFQTVSASRPILQRNATTGAYYLAFDGVDDFLQTNNIDFTATDKVSLFAGVARTVDQRGILLEIGNSSDTNNNTFGIQASSGYFNDIFFAVRSTALKFIRLPITLPKSSIISAKYANGTSTLKVDNVTTIGTVSPIIQNFTNFPLFIGRRGGTTYPFNGHIYSLVGIGRLTTDAETIALEKSIAKNTGVTLSV